jgi:hypothetical protein
MLQKRSRSRTTLGVAFCFIIGCASAALGQATSTRATHQSDCVICESLAGDVYEPGRWRPLELGTLFTDGWDESWASPPNGEGGAPRQGWLNTFDGVFYRLFLFTFGYQSNIEETGGEGYAGGFTAYTPLNRRFELRWDVPFVVSGPDGTSFGDLQITPRLLLSESRNFTQSFDVTVRTPTGDTDSGSGIGAVSPIYNFWYNPWRTLVLRGGVGGFLPYYKNPAREAFIANLAAGYYFTDHDMAPVGDLVGYVSTNLNQLTDPNVNGMIVPDTTTVTITPGFRQYVGANFYLLGGVEVPVTNPKPFDFQLLAAIMKVW